MKGCKNQLTFINDALIGFRKKLQSPIEGRNFPANTTNVSLDFATLHDAQAQPLQRRRGADGRRKRGGGGGNGEEKTTPLLISETL